jgi:hypothetical protein
MLWVVETRGNGHGTIPIGVTRRRGRAASGQAASSGHHVRAS